MLGRHHGPTDMLLAFTFRAKPGKPGKEKEFERLMNNSEAGRLVAKMMGATRNALFLRDGRAIRILDVPDGVRPVPMGELAKREPRIKEFLQALGPLVDDGFDLERHGSLEAFGQRISVPLVYDVRP